MSLSWIYRSWWREKGCRQREILFRPRHRHLIFSSMEYLTWGIKRNRGRKTGLQLFQQRPHIEPPRTSLIARIWEIRRNRSHKKGQKAASSASFLSHVPAVYSACYCGLWTGGVGVATCRDEGQNNIVHRQGLKVSV